MRVKYLGKKTAGVILKTSRPPYPSQDYEFVPANDFTDFMTPEDFALVECSVFVSLDPRPAKKVSVMEPLPLPIERVEEEPNTSLGRYVYASEESLSDMGEDGVSDTSVVKAEDDLVGDIIGTLRGMQRFEIMKVLNDNQLFKGMKTRMNASKESLIVAAAAHLSATGAVRKG